MHEKKIFPAILAFALTALLLPQAFGLFRIATKLLFEGTSYAKAVVFMGWLVLLFGLAFLKSMGRIHAINFRKSFLMLAALLLLAWFLQARMHISVLPPDPDLPPSAIASVLVKEGNTMQWESTHLTHIHATKSALYNLIWWLPLRNFDSGYPMHLLVPLWESWLFLIVGAVLAVLFINEFLKLDGPIQMLLMAIASFAAMVSIFDGGVFSTTGRIAVALLVMAAIYEDMRIKSHHFFLAPFFAVAGLLYLGSFLFDSTPFIYGAVEILTIGFAASILLVAREEKKLKPIWIVAGLCLLFLLAGAVSTAAKGAELFEGESSRLLIYGIPENAKRENIGAALAEFGKVSDIEHYNYIAFATIKADEYLTTDMLEQRLVEKLKPDSYLYVVKGWDEHRAIIKSSSDLNHLLGVDSKYISFRREAAGRKEQIVAQSFFPVHFMNLFVSNSLFFEKGVEVPLVAGIAR